jgi:hypothetical protein
MMPFGDSFELEISRGICYNTMSKQPYQIYELEMGMRRFHHGFEHFT